MRMKYLRRRMVIVRASSATGSSAAYFDTTLTSLPSRLHIIISAGNELKFGQHLYLPFGCFVGLP